MSTYTQILYHIIFSTKHRRKTLTATNHEKLFKYIWGVIKNKKSHLYQINGIEDHIHIVTSLHPTIALSDFIKDIKVSSSLWIKKESIFQNFEAWQIGYAALTYSIKEKETLINYVKNQKAHHKQLSYKEELINILEEAGIEFDMKYLE